MKIDKFNSKILSRKEMREIIGGEGGAVATCADGTKIRCSGDNCMSADYNHVNSGIAGTCSCHTEDGSISGVADAKSCPQL